jgi:hypothetical protein
MVTVAPALLFGLITALMVRNRNIRALEAILVFLFGFFLATTGVGHVIAGWLAQLLGEHAPAHPVPVPPTNGGIPV